MDIDRITDLLQKALKKENIKQFSSVKATKNPAGDGYMGDIIFVEAVGTLANGSLKNYNLVLKCGKQSEALRASFSFIRDIYETEIYAYDQIFPKFTEFQLERGVEDIFDSFPKCYGTFLGVNTEVIALDNLKQSGYYLWDKREPLTRQHLHVVLKAYGKWHAVSAAMKDQQPNEFHEIIQKSKLSTISFSEKKENPAVGIFTNSMKAMYEVMKDHLSESEKKKWLSLEKLIPTIFDPTKSKPDELKVMMHGDCWSNNFMYTNDDEGLPSKVALLDWQAMTLASPANDVSYFLHTCTTEEDLKDYEELLKVYHESFSNHTRKLGSDPDKLYPFPELMASWKRAIPYGVILSTVIMKVVYTDPDNVPDIAENAEEGKDFGTAFNKGDIYYKDRAITRMGYIFRSAVAQGAF